MAASSNEFHLAGDAQVNALLLENATGVTQYLAQRIESATVEGDQVLAGEIRDPFLGVPVLVPTFVQLNGPCSAAELVKLVVQPDPGFLAVHLAVGKAAVPSDGNQKTALQQRFDSYNEASPCRWTPGNSLTVLEY
jgi:hypothetical protein